jgi:hypothetical protein
MTQPLNEQMADRFRKQAQQLIASTRVGDELLSRSATIAIALPVHTPDGSIHSWFVPVTVGDRLAGFFQFLPDGTLMRYSSFQRRSGDLSTCPDAADWLDTERIQSRAGSQRLPGEKLEAPFLTFDRSPDRIVWAVPLINEQGKIRLVYVAGESVYLPPSEGTID